MSKESIAQVLNAGGNVRCAVLAKESLVWLAGIAAKNDVKLEIVGNLAVESLVEIAKAGRGCVTFDISGK